MTTSTGAIASVEELEEIALDQVSAASSELRLSRLQRRE
jgi:hypothetical protein